MQIITKYLMENCNDLNQNSIYCPNMRNFKEECLHSIDRDKRYYKKKSKDTKTRYIARNRNGDEISSHNYQSWKNIPIIKTTVEKLDLKNIKVRRAGVIIYTIENGTMYFGLGLDSRSHDLTDFGGGVVYKTDYNVIRGALREFEEETLGIFESLSFEDIKHCLVMHDDNNLIIFMHINMNPNIICQEFNNKYQQIIERNNIVFGNKYYPEVCGITWLTLDEFRNSIMDTGIIFTRVRQFLWRADKFTHLL